MAKYNRLCVLKNLKFSNLSFSTSSSVCGNWRKKLGLEENPRQFSPLTNLPDYSFVDGRAVPVSARQLEKINFQKNLCKKVVELSEELDESLELYYEKKKQENITKETIIKNKLKPKGAALLKNSKN